LDTHRLIGKTADFLTAFFGCFAIQSSIGITVRNPLTVVLFLCLFLLSGRVRAYFYNGKFRVPVLILPHALGVLSGAVLARAIYPQASGQFTSSLFKAMTFVLLFAGYYLLICLFLKLIILMLRKKDHVIKDVSRVDGVSSDSRFIVNIDKKTADRIVPATAAICFLCYLPYFLYEFPGIMTADSIVQYMQIIGAEPFSNHHPVVHTLMIGLFYKLGMMVTGDPIKAISFYTVAQMIFMSICCGILAREFALIKGRMDMRIFAVLMAFLALFPVNAVFAVTVWKDIPFSCISVLLVCLVSSMLRRGASELSVLDFAVYGVLGILFSLFRSNAWFAFIAFTPVFIYYFREKMRAAAVVSAFAIASVILIKGPVFDAAGVKGPDFVESLSLPLQQVARVLVDDRPATLDDLDMIDKVIDRTYIKELYVSGYADNIKELVRAGNPAVLEDNKRDYLGLWIRLLLKYPGEYIKAWFDLEGGYIYPDVSYKVADADGIMPNDLGLYPTPIIGGKFIKVKEILIKLSDFMPLYGMLFSIGAYAWGLVLTFIIAIKKKRMPLPHLLMLLLLCTLLIAAPVVDFRYGYAYVLSFPILAAISFTNHEEGVS
jgi:hypothetical protein